MPVSSWSTTASNNATADSASGIIWSEGQAPSSINDSARAMMAEIKKSFGSAPLAVMGSQVDASGLSTTAAARFNLDFVATSPVLFASAGYEVVQLIAGAFFTYAALALYDQTAGGTLVVASPESTLAVTADYPQGASFIAANNLTVGSTYRLSLRGRTNSTNSCRFNQMTIQGVCV